MTVPEHPHPELEEHIEELATAVMGPLKSEFAGGGRYTSEGLVHKVDQIITSGIRIRLPWQLGAAIITAVGGLTVQLIATFWGSG
jgi:hypothetical protein